MPIEDYLKGLLRGKPESDVTAEEKDKVLDQMINMQLIAAQGEKEGLDKDPEIATRLALRAHADSGRRRRAEVREEQ